MPIATGDTVTLEYTGRLPDGTVFDTSRAAVAEETGLADEQPDREYGPLTVEVGTGRIIEGLEEELVGLEEGDAPTVTVPAEKGYGEWREDQVQTFDAEEFSGMVGGQTPSEGDFIETRDGEVAEITHADDEVVRVDFNHVLAGETLEFDIEVVDVR